MSKQESLMHCSVNYHELNFSLCYFKCSNHCKCGGVLRSGVLGICFYSCFNLNLNSINKSRYSFFRKPVFQGN